MLHITYAQQPAYEFSSLNINNGLSNNQINAIYKDARGFMWFGTMSGLNRYDGYSFKIFRHSQGDSLSLNDDYIDGIYPAPNKRIYIKTRNGDNLYDPVKEQFADAAVWLRQNRLPTFGVTCIRETPKRWWVAYADSGLYRLDSGQLAQKVALSHKNAKLADICTIGQERLGVLYMDGFLEILDVRTGKVTAAADVATGFIHKPPLLLRLFADAQEDLWIYMPGTDFGVVYYNPATGMVKRLFSKDKVLNNDIVNSIVQDNQGLIWIGTDHGGINVINKADFSSRFLMNREEDASSVAENAIYAMFKDTLGIIWCGTYKRGISYFAENTKKFGLFRHKHADSKSLPYNDVNCFAEDKKGNLWIGTNGGGLIYFERSTGKFTRYQHNPADNNSISSNVVLSLYIDHYENLWIGYYFGGMDFFSNGKITHYRHDDNNPNSLANKTVWKIYRDQRNNFWVGTLGGGLDRFDPGNNIFYHNHVNLPNSVHSNFISAMTEDADGNLWIGTAYGIDVLDKAKGIFVHYLAATHQLGNDNVSSLLRDARGNIWAGTRDGLSVFDPQTQRFHTFRMADGLPDNNIMCILEDDAHHLWVSTTNGLSKITVKQSPGGIAIHCRNFDEEDGLQGRAFNINAALKLRTGELAFGGADGFNIFRLEDIQQHKEAPPLVFTSLQLFNKTIGVNEKLHNHVILPAALPETEEIRLRYNENDFSIDFAALSFVNADKNRYAYMLDGFNKEWQTTDGKSRRVIYTNVPPGNYTLRLKSANEDGVWNEKGISLQIRILPPFWKTPLAYIIYTVLVFLLLFFSRKMVIRRAHMRFALQQERMEAQRLHELDMMKIRLLTNVSHEFRTPVSLILAPLEELLKHTRETDHQQKLQLVRTNAKRLLNLVNQLMDFRKMEMKELKPDPTRGDVAVFVKEVVQSFSDLAERKQVSLSYQSNCEHLYTYFDHDKLERILFNLLSNAFKFTPREGAVTVNVQVTAADGKSRMEIKVEDTGIGIPKERQDKIFERFFQSDTHTGLVNQGSGIGLAITREFVKLANGVMTVESEENKGSCFTVTLPFERSDAPPDAMPATFDPPREVVLSALPAVSDKVERKEQTILLVEDNDDFRFYLKENLKAFYDIIEAPDGKSGWQKALSAHPDLVVSDINMPQMDGMELCRKIKNDSRTRHIPVILLTAMSGEQEQLQGLEAGAVDYMVKPFNFEIMLSRVRNILNRQAPVKLVVGSSSVAGDRPVSADEKFLQRALEIVEKQLSNADFSVEELSRELCMNRVSVYRRIFSITGQTPVEFIRTVRLRKAAQLLAQTEMNVTEVAYEVGFNNPKYFAKYFKIAYKMLPSAYASAMRKV
ncbi:hybrid sensor histidine kinase/response regulator transcription factor [uncultured Chitinophaga sp.]|uniref:hybrid sensor histidine kinase/response regulator transcription factor n=1 Tax=uncultured Chitinophaga sp. TaxID=339340 RepID=UPI002615638F|nr:hybrid sensor histidine kinase/response regulator transcription factor [uncultured Chitinophaga sp.]